jgi:hypothetical protein
LKASKQILSPPDAIRLLEDYLQIIRRALACPTMSAGALGDGVHPNGAWRSGDWSTGANRVDLAGIRRELERHPAVKGARVFAVDDTIAACAAIDAAPEVMEDLLGRLRMRASWDCGIAIPDTVVLCPEIPARPDDLASWIAARSFTRDGAVPPFSPDPVDEREASFAAVFSSLCPGARPDMNATYAQLGGDFRRLPAMVRRLADHGHTGLHWRELAGIATLRDLARKNPMLGELSPDFGTCTGER